jgi:putative hydrolase of the HAD superfamily
MIQAVLFDLDNTLIDFMRMKEASCKAAITAMVDAGLPLEEKKAYNELFKLYKTYGMEYQKIFQQFIKKFMKEIDYRVLSQGITAYRRTQVGFLMPYPHTRSTLLKLKEKGLKLGIVSDAPRMRAWLRLSEMNLTEYFDLVVTLDDTGKRKPHKMPFEAALKKLAMPAERILFVGDRPDRDIKGAQAVGMKTALAKYGSLFPSKGIKADFELKDVKDLLKVIEK